MNVFITTLENITRLALNLVALCKAGHVKYLSWKQTFDCVSLLKKSEELDSTVSERLERLRNRMRKIEEEMEKTLKSGMQECLRSGRNFII